tara:strand:- start:11467 stop:12789 length:1323 start_codon:yes stop_codon:yes gene_type:complete
MKLFRLLFFSSILFFTTTNADVWIDPIIKQNIINKGAEELSVIVLLKGAPSPLVSSSLEERRLSKSRILRVLSNLGLSEAELRRATILWSVNGVHIYLNSDQIVQLAKTKELQAIIYDFEISLDIPKSFEPDIRDQKITWGIKKINLIKVWNELKLTGKNVKVGVLDTGYSDHPALRNRVVADRSFTFGQKFGPTDGHGHGTHCAGTIGGTTVDGKVIGVAQGVDFVIGRIFNNKGKGSLSLMLKGMQWIADPDENPATKDYPAVVSNSWGTAWKNQNKIEALLRAVQTWKNVGIIPVFAAGNSGPRPQTILIPGVFDESITIGSTDRSDRIARFSSQGPGVYLGNKTDKPDLTAPGVSVYSADLNGKYTYRSGTSMATPHITGIIAIMLEANPNLDTEQVRKILKESSIDLGDSGYDYAFGSGRIDAYNAAIKALQSLN